MNFIGLILRGCDNKRTFAICMEMNKSAKHYKVHSQYKSECKFFIYEVLNGPRYLDILHNDIFLALAVLFPKF